MFGARFRSIDRMLDRCEKALAAWRAKPASAFTTEPTEGILRGPSARAGKPQAYLSYPIRPDPLQLRVLQDPSPRKVCIWGRGRGKTFTALTWLYERALAHPQTDNWYVAPTYKQAKLVAWDSACHLFSRAVLAGKPRESELCFHLTNGSVIHLMGAEDPDRLRGKGIWSVVLDEYATMRQDAWTRVLQPQLARTRGHALFIGTPNALRGPHLAKLWLRVDSGELAGVGWKGWMSPTADAAHFPPEAIEKARRELRPWEFRQEYEVAFETLGGRIWPEFSQLHLDQGGHVVPMRDGEASVKPCPRGWQVFAGVDWGYSPHPAAIVWIAVGPSQQVLVLAEYVALCSRLQEIAHHARKISEVFGGVENVLFFADPSQPGAIADFNTTYQLRTLPANNSVALGHDRVGRLLGRRELLIASCCQNLIRGVLEYSYDPRSSAPRVLKEKDDECDALRYAVMGAMPPPDPEALTAPKGEWEEDPAWKMNWRSNDWEEQWAFEDSGRVRRSRA